MDQSTSTPDYIFSTALAACELLESSNFKVYEIIENNDKSFFCVHFRAAPANLKCMVWITINDSLVNIRNPKSGRQVVSVFRTPEDVAKAVMDFCGQ